MSRPWSLRRPAATGAGVLLAALALAVLPAGAASAHPLGNFTVNRYDGLVVAPGTLRIDHDEDLAEIPTTQAEPRIEQLGLAAWAQDRCTAAARGSVVTVAGRRVTASVGSARARLLPGQARLHTLRVECGLTAPLPARGSAAVGFHSAGDTAGPGWREITARGDRMTLTASDVPARSVSRELTSYPKNLLSSPADRSTAALRFRPGGPALAPSTPAAPAASVLPRGIDRWTQAFGGLVGRHGLTPGFAAFALAVSIALGALHALTPGHGKTLMAATAAARGGARPRDVLPLAAAVTVTHTLGVLALGLLVAAGSTATASVIGWLGLAGGVLVTATGANLLRRALRARRAAAPPPNAAHGHGEVGHRHEPAGRSHQHPHVHAEHAGSHVPGHTAVRTPAPAPAHPHEHAGPATPRTHTHTHTHTHGGRTHTHAVAPTVRGTLLLGFAGGMVPSPSAVVVLVGATALGRAWFGVLLVVGYGAGLALTLTAAGFAVVKAGHGVARAVRARRPRVGGRSLALASRLAPVGSAAAVLLVGAGLILRDASAVLG